MTVYQFDDSQLGQVKELVSDLRTRLQVAEKMVNAESNLHDEIPIDATAPADIVDQVTTYFDHNAEKPADEAKAEAAKTAATEKTAEAPRIAKADK